MIWGKSIGNGAFDDPDEIGEPDTEAFSAEEGLELIQVFQGIRYRADRRAALDLIRHLAAHNKLSEGATVKPHA